MMSTHQHTTSLQYVLQHHIISAVLYNHLHHQVSYCHHIIIISYHHHLILPSHKLTIAFHHHISLPSHTITIIYTITHHSIHHLTPVPCVASKWEWPAMQLPPPRSSVQHYIRRVHQYVSTFGTQKIFGLQRALPGKSTHFYCQINLAGLHCC